jgi:hypothetical protein
MRARPATRERDYQRDRYSKTRQAHPVSSAQF